jgi:site-specific recombinase
MQTVQRWRHFFKHRTCVETLLSNTPTHATSLRRRIEWLGDLVNWIRIEGDNRAETNHSPRGHFQNTRLKYLLQVLDRNPDYHSKVGECLRSILDDTQAMEFFMHVGVPNQQGFIGELSERLSTWLLPLAPLDHNLEFIFSETFCYESDAEWIEQMDPAIFRGWLNLFLSPKPSHSETKILRELKDAFFLTAHTVRTTGLSRLVRNRVQEKDFRRLPFYTLTDRVEAMLHTNDPRRLKEIYFLFDRNIDECFETTAEVYAHFRKHGMSIELVYQMERLKELLERCRILGTLLLGNERHSPYIQSFLGLLIRENVRARKIGNLLKDNLALISRKIVETNAEAGEHYITRDRKTYIEILKKSWGGGAITGITTFVKFAIFHFSVPPFFSGIFAFLNYSFSFITLQMLGFTLATKQPAMTASALAAKIEESGDSMEALIEEIIHLVRSQLAAVIGNLTMVVPVVILIDLLYINWGSHLVDTKTAIYTVDSFSILGPTPMYAAGTGVLLWLSSVFAGWFGNWFNFRNLPAAIEHHSRLRYVLGERKTKRLGAFLKVNVPGFSANLSLAFLLGMTPQFASFFGFPFDVRHVTLSSGALTAACMSLGADAFTHVNFWFALIGIGSMGALNLAVAFALALTVAIWAKKVSAPRRGLIYRALLRKFLSQPWIFFFPTNRSKDDSTGQ